ncbi:MAG: B12-binding domain-containing radical SAM protein [Planctomycetes bacterium]|nr:B12-binding domain-containing radical SAM protein [Planctomycetota bacterium]
MRVLLLRPPRYVWPFNSETSAFWQPLGLLAVAAAARRELPDARVAVWDAPGGKFGWRTLERRLAAYPIDVLGLGEETCSAHEALRAAELAKRLHPGCVVAAGGTYFAHTIEETLADGRVDAIVRGEGEETFVEFLRRLHDPGRWCEVAGLAFRGAGGRIVVTPPRPLIADLDRLPFPAYDLVDMSAYGRGSRNHPALVSIEHSRGCIDSCSFCILWKHMGEPADGNGTLRPRWRTKSPERGFEEVARLYRDFGRRTFGWVDPTFNASAGWSDRWADLVLRSDLVDARGRPRTLHTAWLRADCVVRDERLGVLGKLVRAGLRQVMIGVERDRPGDLAALGKHGCGPEVCRAAFAVLREKHPQVYTIGSVIFGLPQDGPADLARLAACELDMQMDYCFLIPLTPCPGTAPAAEAAAAGRLANRDRASYNFHTPACTTDALGLRDLESLYWREMLRPDLGRARRWLRQALLERDPRKRRVHLAMLSRGTRIAVESLLRSVLGKRNGQPALYSRRPSWYDQ